MDSIDGDEDLPAFGETVQRLKLLLPRLLERDSISFEEVDRLVEIVGDAIEAVDDLRAYAAPEETSRLEAFLHASEFLDALVDPHAAEAAERRSACTRYLHRLFHEPHWPVTLGAAALLLDLRPRPPSQMSPEVRSAVDAMLAQLDDMTLLMESLGERAERDFTDREVDWERATEARRRLAPKFRNLADRFRQIATGGADEDVFEAAAEEGVRLCRRLVDAGYFVDICNVGLADGPTSKSWVHSLNLFRAMYPDRFPSRAQRAAFLGIRKQDWVVLAMDSAAACEEIGELVETDEIATSVERRSEVRSSQSYPGMSSNGSSHSLERALDILRDRLLEPRRLWDLLLRFVDEEEVDEAVRRFAKEVARSPAWRAELERRANFLAESTRDASSFAQELDAVREKLIKAGTGRTRVAPDDAEVLGQCRERLDAIRGELPLFLGASVRSAIGSLNRYGRSASIPADVGGDLLRLAARAQDLDDVAERDACDGCYVLLSALYASTPEGAVDTSALRPRDFGGGMLAAIQAAAESLVAFARTAEIDTASGEAILSQISHLEATTSRKPLTIDDRMHLLIKNDSSVRGWTAKEFADSLGCSAGTVKETSTWKELMSRRRDQRTAGSVDRRRRRSTVDGGDWEEESFD